MIGHKKWGKSKILKVIVLFIEFDIMKIWQHFGNKKSVRQNKLYNRSK